MIDLIIQPFMCLRLLIYLCNTLLSVDKYKKTMMVHNNLIKSTLVAAATVGALLTSTPAFSASITNGDFETPSLPGLDPELGSSGFFIVGEGQTIPGPLGYATLEGGSAYLGRTVVNNNGALSRTVQLNGANTQGGIVTAVTGLIQGQTLDVFFDLSGNPFVSTPPSEKDTELVAPVVTVSLENGTSQQIIGILPVSSPSSNGAFANLTFQSVVASLVYNGTSSTAALSFTSQSGTNLGPIIDNVTVTAVPFEFSPVSGFIIGGVLFGASKLIKLNRSNKTIA